jgi:hypothetical protein
MTNTSMNNMRIIKGFGLLVLVALLGLAKTYLIVKVIGICVGISLLVALIVFDWKNRDNSDNLTRIEFLLSMALINFTLCWYILPEFFMMSALSWTSLALATASAHFGKRTDNEE